MIVRICELKKKDVFEMYGIERQVISIENGRLYYRYVSHNISGKDHRLTLGAKSKQNVILKTVA